ncbi:hypothetical protein FS837_002679 [Tulasnella sp. UAMH 9824]|nr:hypothetical protein FS837_002679 [Tulasnella sp. UAMH 9824]
MTQGEEEEDGESSPSGESSFKCQGGGIPAHHYRGLDHYPDPEADGPTTSVTNTDEEEEENMTSDNTGGPDSDQEMTEEEETEAIVEEPMTSGYEADHSESDAPRSPQQRRQATPHPRAPLSPSDLRAISETPSTTANAPHPRAVLSPSDLVDTPPTTGNAGTAEIDPPASQSTTRGTNNVLGPLLDSTEDELMGDAAKASEVDGLINGLSGLALPPPDQVQPAPSSQSGQTTTPGEGLQDSPDTSAESEVLRGMVERSLAGTLGVDYIKVMAPAGHGGTGFVEVRRE